MSDGFSDKSVSPCTWTPTAGAEGLIIPKWLDTNIVSDVDAATITNNKLVPRSDFRFLPYSVTLSDAALAKLQTVLAGADFGQGSCFGVLYLSIGAIVLKSTDSGSSWSLATPTPATSQIGEMQEGANSRIIANYGRFSDDGGATWIGTANGAYNGAIASNKNGTVLVAYNPATGLGGATYVSTNNGQSYADAGLGTLCRSLCYCSASDQFFVFLRETTSTIRVKKSSSGISGSWSDVGVYAVFTESNGRCGVRNAASIGSIIYYKCHTGKSIISYDGGNTFAESAITISPAIPASTVILQHDTPSKSVIVSTGSYTSNAFQFTVFKNGVESAYAPESSGQAFPLGTQFFFWPLFIPLSTKAALVVYVTSYNTQGYISSIRFSKLDLEQITAIFSPPFQPTSPAKLSAVNAITITLDNTGANGTITAYLQHKNDEIGDWCSLDNILGARTSLGVVTSGTPLTVPAFECRAGEKIRLVLDVKSNDGISPAPAITGISIPWASDVVAPASPSIVDLSDASKGSSIGYRVELGNVPSDAREMLIEGKINNGEYLPFSKRAKFETGYDYMRFRGHIDQIEAAGERNEKHVDYRTGLNINDVVQIKVAAEDSVGNRSAFVESSQVVLKGATYVPVLTTGWKEVWKTDNWRVVWNR